MADVKIIVQKSDGSKSELSASDVLTIPSVSSAPVGNPPAGYIYLYVLDADNHLYQKDETGVVIDLGASGGGSSYNDLVINTGYPAKYLFKTNIINPLVTISSSIVVEWGICSITDENNSELTNVRFFIEPKNGSFDVSILPNYKQKIGGIFNLKYKII